MKNLIAVLIFFSVTYQLHAQKIPLANTTLWKISGKGLANNSYIYITDITCEEGLKLEPGAKKALDSVSSVIVEYDLYGSKDASKLASDAIAKTDAEKIKNNLTPAQLTAFENKLKDAGYPEQSIPQLQVYKVSMVYVLLSGLVGPCGIERQPLAYETELKPLAKKLNKNYGTLQTIDEFLKEINQLNGIYWGENISYILNHEDNIKLQLKREADLYKSKNLTELQKLYSIDKFYKLLHSSTIQKEHTYLLSDKIDALIKQASCFITIQFSNIAYQDYSVFEILAAKGYTIAPVVN